MSVKENLGICVCAEMRNYATKRGLLFKPLGGRGNMALGQALCLCEASIASLAHNTAIKINLSCYEALKVKEITSREIKERLRAKED